MPNKFSLQLNTDGSSPVSLILTDLLFRRSSPSLPTVFFTAEYQILVKTANVIHIHIHHMTQNLTAEYIHRQHNCPVNFYCLPYKNVKFDSSLNPYSVARWRTVPVE